jgi:HD superfamily phosphohydrolase
MIFYDTMFGRFELPSFLTPLLTAPEFRRLSEVRLININSPSFSALSEVRRYSHTIGVLRLAVTNNLPNFGKDEYRALLASVIVHDAGTPAFAHLFEYQLNEQFDWNHETVVPSILQKRHHLDGLSHQFYASRPPEFEKLCRGAGIDFDLVLAILSHRHRGSKLLFGSVDFDNLDNVARMNWMMGLHFDVNFILQLSAALGADDVTPLLLPEVQRDNLERWAAMRRRAYEMLVFDGPTVAGQAVLSTLISEALISKALAVEDWHYTDQQLLGVLQGMSPAAKDRIQRDLLGRVPELRLLAHITDLSHPLVRLARPEVAMLITAFLKSLKINRPYGYCLRDRGTFEKRISAVDPTTGKAWTIGMPSNSLIIYGFGSGGRRGSPNEIGREFLSWYENRRC